MVSGPSLSRPWSIIVVAVAILPVLGLFTTHRIFFARDLSLFFWSRHLWLRHTLAAGSAPWWDPYVAGGQSAIADALHQLLMPVTLAIRLLPSAVVSFNLWVALPVPVAALGTLVFLRRRTGDQAAALGACAFALSGPIVSMLNAPNLSWSVACLPWVMWCCQRIVEVPSARRGAALAVLFALQALCGEPVTWAATGLLAIAFGLVEGRRVLPGALVIGALCAGALLAAAQLIPTAMTGIRAQRSLIATPDFWSLHPLALMEMLVPHLFGNYDTAFLVNLPWMEALNFGRDPFFYSLYVGPLVLLLASVGVITRFRRSLFWLAVAICFLLAALGGYTPAYPLFRKLLPFLTYFRFPVKYIVFTVFALAVLTAEGWAAVLSRPAEGGHLESSGGGPLAGLAMWLGAAVSVALVACSALLVLPAISSRVAYAMASANQLKDPAAAAEFMAQVGPPTVVRTLALLLAGCVLLVVAARERRRRAAALLVALTCANLAITNRGLNPTMNVAGLAPPRWYTDSAGSSRLYVGGRVRGFMNKDDPDGAAIWQLPPARTPLEGRMAINAELPMAPSGWSVREALSYDLPYLWPAEYEGVVRQFEQADHPERAAFLRRAGVGRCVLPVTEVRLVRRSPGGDGPWRVAAEVPDWNMAVFECNPGATRVFLASPVEIASDPEDLAWQRAALFNVAFADTVARLSKMPPVTGSAGTPEPQSVRIVEDAATAVTVEAAAPRASILVLRDSYDPSWTAQVDGVPVEIVRANVLYRAVAVPAGRHVIRFAYRPRDLRRGLIISAMTALTLLAVVVLPRWRRDRAAVPASSDAGFTLVELMVVMAIIGILLAIAFSEYRGMKARGNDASALASLRSIAVAQAQFSMTCGNMKYATTLPALAQPIPSTGLAFLSPDLTEADSFEKSGYVFQMASKPLDGVPPGCNGSPLGEGYAATADPARPGTTGHHYYGVNRDRVLYIDDEQTFTGNLPESGPPPHGSEVK